MSFFPTGGIVAPAESACSLRTLRDDASAPPVPQDVTSHRTDAVRANWWNVLRPPGALPGTNAQSGSGDVFAAIARFVRDAQRWLDALAAHLTFGQNAPAGPQATFQSADLASVGDPHLGLTGRVQNSDGSTSAVDSHYDSMTDHADLLDSNDFGDGLRVATTVTPPDARGITSNQRATATLNGGNDAVTLDRDGTLAVVSNGRAVVLAPGESTTLAGGATVARGGDGSVTIREDDGNGKSLATTFRATGAGVDVTAHAAGGVTLGGDLVARALPA